MRFEYDGKDFLTAKDISVELGFSKSKVYDLLNQDDFPTIKIGGTYLVPREEFEKFMKRNLYKEYKL